MKKPYFGVMLIQRISSDGMTHTHCPFFGMWNSPIEARQSIEDNYRKENPSEEFQVMKFTCNLADEEFCIAAAGYYLEQKGKI